MTKNIIFKGYHHQGNRYRAGLEGRKQTVLSDPALSQAQRDTLTKWADERKANSFKENNTVAYLYTLRDLGLSLKEPYEKGMNENNKKSKIEAYITKHPSPYYRKLIKQFYRWLNNGDLPYCVKWLITRERKTEKKSKPILSDEEIAAMVKVE